MPDRTVATPDGVELFVVDLGDATAPPLLVMHGGPAAHHDYLLPAFARLADQRRVILYDQRGGGKSRAPAGVDLTHEAHVGDMGVVLDALGVARADVAAYSFGGLYAMMFALRHPERVGKLALCSSVPAWHGYREGLDRAMAAAAQSPFVVGERRALDLSGMRERLPEEVRRRRFALSVAGYFKDPRLAYALTPFRVQANAAEVVRKGLGDFDLRPELAALDGRRVLVIHGEDDPIEPRFARETAEACGARLELIPDCGHVPYVEAAERFFAILRAFLGDPS